jgi:hypothetical protein
MIAARTDSYGDDALRRILQHGGPHRQEKQQKTVIIADCAGFSPVSEAH